ncbi:MAG: hypothetical protein Q7W55_07830 [Pseudohongiella sp.]|nr:hypothetical protein [Pseudohongiella sp.]MDO9521340.1 hypothetical protein [Pseudohongiella sp.]MDP2125893.1 hypothetical protein [Pseudohongiella sp.]
MRQLTPDHLTELLGVYDAPCVSLYIPTHRSHPENQRDPLVYKNILKSLETSLAEKYPAEKTRPLLEKLSQLGDDKEFWNYRTEGLAILASPALFRVFDLQRPVPELGIAADSFHIKPLLRVLQSADRYHILCINREEARLYEGTRDTLDQVELRDVPSTLTEALGEQVTDPHLTVASYGMRGSGAGDKAMFHGQGSRTDEVKGDTERFFRTVDRAIAEHYSKPSGLPLLLAALTEHHAVFRSVSHNANLLDEGLMMNTGLLTLDELRAKAWEKLEPLYLQRLATLTERYHNARANQLGAKTPEEAALAALDGRIEVLLIDADKQIPGRIDRTERRIHSGELSDPDMDDVLDDLAELALRSGGEVVIVPAERMPTDTGVAAIFRY